MARRAVGLIGPGQGPLIAVDSACKAVVRGLLPGESVTILGGEIKHIHVDNGRFELGVCDFVQFSYEGQNSAAFFAVEA